MNGPQNPFRKPAFPKPGAKPAAPSEPTLCVKCQTVLDPGAGFCGECGTPVKSGLKPKQSMQEIRRKAEGRKNRNTIQNGRNYLLLLAFIQIGIFLFVYFTFRDDMAQLLRSDDPVVREMTIDSGRLTAAEYDRALWFAKHWFAICFLSEGLPGLIYIGLCFWARSSPLPAVTAGLVTYLTFLVASIALSPAKAVGGLLVWLFRIAVITALGDAIRSAATERRIEEKRKRAAEQERLRAEAEAESAAQSIVADGGEPARDG